MKKKLSFIIITLILGLTACTKKRETQFAYGEGTDLFKIEDYDNKYFDLKTTEANGQLVYHSAQKTTKKFKGKTQDFQYVKYESTSDLFPKEISFIGKMKHNYKLVYQLTNTHLIISKVGTDDEIPIEELTSAQTIDKNLYAVPLVSYRISGYYTVDNTRNEYREKTSTLREYKAETKAQATHFRFDRNSKQVLTLKLKTNLFKKDYFEGTWFTSSVISKVADEESSLIGQSVSYDSKWDSADKIIFAKSKEKIIGLNARYDERVKLGDDLDKRNNLSEVIYFPVNWVSYKRDTNNGELNETENDTKRWEERDYVEVDFTKITSPISGSLAGTPTLTDLTATDDFFMFSLQFQGAKVTFSFLKADKKDKVSLEKYEPRRYFSEDFKYFGFFTTRKKSLNTYEKYRREDFEKQTFINRFHPKKDKITGRNTISFYLTDASTSEPELIDTARNAIQSWDFAFKQAGLVDTDIILNETERVAVGDLRYNSINLIKTITSSSLLGFGPSLADPDTGEIISATTNVHITSVKTHLVSQLRNYIRHQRDELTPNYPLGKTNQFQSPQIAAIKTSMAQNVSNKEKDNSQSVILKTPQILNQTYSKHTCDFESSAGNLIRDIESNIKCEKLKSYAKNKSANLNEEAQALESCADALLPQKVQGTLIHELGHNLGLRHNFAASADFINYAKKRDPKTGLERSEIMARSSSVMEYTDFNEDRLTQVGPYDIEVIRYGYGNAIKDTQDKIKELKPDLSIDENLKALGIQKKPYRFCTDEHVELGMDPLCQRHDSGATPLEVTESIISQYNTLFATQNFKYDRAKSPSPSGLKDYKNEVIFNRLRMIYDQWRVYLTDYVGLNNQSLEVFDDKSFAKVLEDMSKDPKFGPYYASYRPAADRIFNFLIDITFMPSKYCLTQLSDGQYDIQEFGKISKEIKDKTGIQVISCNDKEVLSLLASINQKLISEVGFFHQNQKRANDVNTFLQDYVQSKGSNADSLDSYWDIIGAADDKDLAKDTLTNRSTNNSSKNFFARQRSINPSFLDEPQYRHLFIERLTERVLKGISLESIMPGQKEIGAEKTYFPKWEEEYNHIKQTWAYMTLGISKIDKDRMNEERAKRWFSVTTFKEEDINGAVEKEKLDNGSYVIATSNDNDITVKIIQRLRWLKKIRKEQSEEYRRNQIDFDAQYGLLTLILKI